MDKRFEKLLAEANLLVSADSLDALRSMVRSALAEVCCACDPMAETCACTVSCSCMDGYVYIRDIFHDQVVYEFGYSAQIYQRSYAVKKGEVTFGAPSPVQIAYAAIDATSMQESHRIAVRESIELREAASGSKAYDATKGELTITVIQPGFNVAKSRYYTESALKSDYKIFEGAKMFTNHATDAESRMRPEGDINQWTAQLTKTWTESDGTVKGTAVIVDPQFKAKCERLQEAGLLAEMGVSIRAIGHGSSGEVDGIKTEIVEGFTACRSVDFVTFAGAGGRIEAIESDRSDEHDVELITVAQLRERRPDLVLAVESNAQEKTMKTIEMQLSEARTQLAEAVTRAEKAEKEVKESKATAARAVAATELNKLLSESTLPEAAKTRLTKQFAMAESTDGFVAAIAAEADYIKSFAPAAARNLGKKQNEVNESAAGAGDPTDATEIDLTESFSAFGLSKEEAALAAKR